MQPPLWPRRHLQRQRRLSALWSGPSQGTLLGPSAGRRRARPEPVGRRAWVFRAEFVGGPGSAERSRNPRSPSRSGPLAGVVQEARLLSAPLGGFSPLAGPSPKAPGPPGAGRRPRLRPRGGSGSGRRGPASPQGSRAKFRPLRGASDLQAAVAASASPARPQCPAPQESRGETHCPCPPGQGREWARGSGVISFLRSFPQGKFSVLPLTARLLPSRCYQLSPSLLFFFFPLLCYS